MNVINVKTVREILNTENVATRHRHGKAWKDLKQVQKDFDMMPLQFRDWAWVCGTIAVFVLVWFGLILGVRAIWA